jgi:arsenate reductase
MSITIYHNPRCTKSRQTLQLLEEKGFSPQVVEYLKQPPSVAELTEIIAQLAISPRQLLRKQEEEFKTEGLADQGLTDRQIIEAMVRSPKLIERPIVIANGKAAIGRPPEAVLAIL